MPHRSEKLTFTGANGAELAGRLDLPIGEPKAHALFAHCFTCSKDSLAAAHISRALADLGIAVLRFDFTGLGSSAGDFGNTNFSSNVEDLIAAAAHLRASNAAPRILVGHSLGGAAALAAAGRIPELAAVVTINAPSDPERIRRHFVDATGALERDGVAAINLGGRTFHIRQQFLDDIEQISLKDHIANLHAALLVMHAPTDEIVGIENAREIFRVAKHPKSYITLDNANHMLSSREDAIYVARVLSAWVSRYLPHAEPTDVRNAKHGEVLVREERSGKFVQRVTAGKHSFYADEPASMGGDDSGLSPYELVLAGLGCCTAMTLRLYADRKKLPLERVTVKLSHEKIHAEDCESCETREGMLDRIDREITLDGDLDEAVRARLLEIADKCPVHRTLQSEVIVRTFEKAPAR
jgi:putative redox protein